MTVRYHADTYGEAQGRRLDRLVEFDDRSRLYPVRSLMRPVGATSKVRKKRLWTPGVLLDQGQDGACVGFGWSAEAAATPVKAAVDNNFGFNWYHEAQKRDPWKDTPHEGSTVLAGAKAGVELGILRSYHWCFSIDDVIDSICFHSPVVVGTIWLNSMFDVDENGFIVVDFASGEAGGHCYCLYGWCPANHPDNPLPNKEEDVFVMRQSWGAWGVKDSGSAYMRRSAVEHLLASENDGEACVATDIRKVAA
jgi:hypothetical protein